MHSNPRGWVYGLGVMFLIAGRLPRPCGAESAYRPVGETCPADQVRTLQSALSCTASPGFVLFASEEQVSDTDGWSDGRVQSICGIRGRLTRLQAHP